MIRFVRQSAIQKPMALLVILAALMVWAAPIHAQEPADRPGTVFFNWWEPKEGRSSPAFLSDADSDLRDQRWQWSHSDTQDGPFIPIDGAIWSSYTPRAAMWAST